ncbi:MAG TPA: SIMPL domain-containing protein [Acidimicrobiales bacterium]|nr:SIMPL domain-containing protein [Acidimicrobiales bacterium]
MRSIRAATSGLGLLGATALAPVLLAACGTSDPPAATPISVTCSSGGPRLTVTGNGQATGTPNVLTLVSGVSVTDPTANEAMQDADNRTAALVGAMKGGGVAAADIQTSDLSLQPQFNFANPPVFVGYQVDNSITATLRNLATAGSIVDSVTAAAGDAARIDSLTFSMSDQSGIEDQARSVAVEQARTHAETMAAAAGERLGPICSLSDQSQPSFPEGELAPAYASNSQAQLPIEPGSQQVSAQVTIVYSLRS